MSNPTKTDAKMLVQPAAWAEIAPPHSTFSVAPTVQVDFQDGEYSSATPQTGLGVIDFAVPSSLTKRRLYGALWTNTGTPAENWIKTQIGFLFNGSPVGFLPWSVGASTALLKKSLPSFLGGGGNIVGQDLTLTIDQPVAGWLTSPVILQPFEFTGTFDRITVSIQDLQAVTALRIYLGVFSYAA